MRSRRDEDGEYRRLSDGAHRSIQSTVAARPIFQPASRTLPSRLSAASPVSLAAFVELPSTPREVDAEDSHDSRIAALRRTYTGGVSTLELRDHGGGIAVTVATLMGVDHLVR